MNTQNRILLIYIFALIPFLYCKSQVTAENEEVTMSLANKLKQVPKFDQKTGYYYGYNRITMKTGVYDKNGEEVVPCIYNVIGPLEWIVDYSICSVSDFNRENVAFYDVRNKKEINLDYDEMSLLGDAKYRFGSKDAFFLIKKDNKEGIWLAQTNKEIVPCKYDKVIFYPLESIKYWKVKNNNNWGIVKDGIEIIPCGNYDKIDILDFADIARISTNGKWGIANLKDGKTYPCKYDAIEEYGEGLLACKLNGKWGFIDCFSNECVEPIYDKVRGFKDGVAQVIKDGKASFIKHPIKNYIFNSDHVPVDENIPVSRNQRLETFAFVVANENYKNIDGADYSINDGKVFTEYCKKTLGIPEQNIKYYEDASFGNMKSAVKRISDIADVYDGSADIIFYFSGLGYSDVKTNETYILPIDVTLESLNSTAICLNSFINELSRLNTDRTLIIIDAPFNGTNKRGNIIGNSRGVRIAPKRFDCKQNIITWISNIDNTTSISCSDKQHGIFTYYLLEYLQNNYNSISFDRWDKYVKERTRKESLEKNKAIQTPFMYTDSSILSF